jgi:hypothetical protein
VLRSGARWTSGWPITQGSRALLDHLANHMPNKTPKQLENTLQRLLGSTRRVFRPEFTPKAYKSRPLGRPDQCQQGGGGREQRHPQPHQQPHA